MGPSTSTTWPSPRPPEPEVPGIDSYGTLARRRATAPNQFERMPRASDPTAYAAAVARILDLVPRAFAALAGLCVALWGLASSWELVFGEPGAVVAGLGLLLVGTPLPALLAAALNFWCLAAPVAPIRWVVHRHQRRTPVTV